MPNFTLQDITGSMIATLAFATVLCAPGWALGHGTDLFGFRSKSVAERAAWAIMYSFGTAPIVSYFAGRYLGLGWACFAMTSATAYAVGVVVWERPRLGWHRREWLLAGGAALVWSLFVIVSLVDVQIGHKLYFSVAIFDQSYRVAFTEAIARNGVPPPNPLYFAGHLQSMRYYYFWYVICAMVERSAHVTARQSFIASSVWTGFGLVAAIGLYTRYFFGVVRGVRRQTWIAVSLLTITGADLLPAIGSLFAQPALNGEMEWWSIDQFYSWQESLLWVPHHVAALVCCLLSFLLLWRTREPLSRGQRMLAVAVAGVAFASAFGLSIYLAFGFALLMLAWVVLLVAARPRTWNLCGRIVAAAVVSLVMIAPFLRELTSTASTVGSGTSSTQIFSLSVRRMIDPELVTGLPLFTAWNRAHPVLLDVTMRLLLLLPGLALELGFYGVVLVLFARIWHCKLRALDEPHNLALYLTVCGLVMVLFIRSVVINNNDFGYRAALLAQFFLLLLSSSLLASWWMEKREMLIPATPGRRKVLYGLLALGFAGTAYQAVMLRMFLPIEELYPANGFAYLPAVAFQARMAFAELDRIAPKSAVIEFNPVDPTVDRRGDVVTPFTFLARIVQMDSDRQILDAEPECAAEFGGDEKACQPIRQATNLMYGRPVPGVVVARQYCNRFGVEYLVVSRLDDAWSDVGGWANRLPVVASEPDLRIVACGR